MALALFSRLEVQRPWSFCNWSWEPPMHHQPVVHGHPDPRQRDATPKLSSESTGGLNGSTQHFLEVYSQESENLKSLVGVDLSAALLCSDPTGNSRSGLFSSGSIVVTARWCFRSSRVAKDSADHRSKLSHLWPP